MKDCWAEIGDTINEKINDDLFQHANVQVVITITNW